MSDSFEFHCIVSRAFVSSGALSKVEELFFPINNVETAPLAGSSGLVGNLLFPISAMAEGGAPLMAAPIAQLLTQMPLDAAVSAKRDAGEMQPALKDAVLNIHSSSTKPMWKRIWRTSLLMLSSTRAPRLNQTLFLRNSLCPSRSLNPWKKYFRMLAVELFWLRTFPAQPLNTIWFKHSARSGPFVRTLNAKKMGQASASVWLSSSIRTVLMRRTMHVGEWKFALMILQGIPALGMLFKREAIRLKPFWPRLQPVCRSFRPQQLLLEELFADGVPTKLCNQLVLVPASISDAAARP